MLPKHLNLEIATSLIPIIHRIGLEHGTKLFDNYNFRTMAMYVQVQKIWDDLVLSKKRTGVDSTSIKYNLKDVEFKTGNDDKQENPLKTSFMWDKQLEDVRRKKTLESDAFVLGRFECEGLQIILIGYEKETLDFIRSLMLNKQKILVENWNKNISEGKRGGTDAIRLNYEELLQKNDIIWSLWIGGCWHESISSKDCLAIISNLPSIN